MKKLFLSLVLFASSLGLVAAGVHIPAAGPIQLGDVVAGGVVRGAIMQAVINNNPANPNPNPTLAAANAAIAQFDGQGQQFKAYQVIITNISQAVNGQVAIDAVKGFENVIMHLYDYDAYMMGGYKPGVSIFVPTGIRWSWINPTTYFSPKSYFSDNDARLKQLIDELDKLANVVKIHSIVEYARIKATVHSYRHWRRNTMLAMVAYLAADMFKHGYQDSIVNQFYQGGLENADEIVINHLINISSGLHCVGKGVGKCVQGIWNVGCKVGNVVLHGKKAFAKTNVQQPELKPNKAKVPEKVKNLEAAVSAQPVAALKSSQKFPQKSFNIEEEMNDFELARYNAFEALDKNKQLKNQIENQNGPQGQISRATMWKSLAASCGKVVKFEVDEREKRRKIWNDRLAQMKNAWNGVSTSDAVVHEPVVLAPVSFEKKQELPSVVLPVVNLHASNSATNDPLSDSKKDMSSSDKPLSQRQEFKNYLSRLKLIISKNKNNAMNDFEFNPMPQLINPKNKNDVKTNNDVTNNVELNPMPPKKQKNGWFKSLLVQLREYQRKAQLEQH